MNYKIGKSKLSGTIKVPSSKSHTLRAILLASMARGKSIIRDYLPSPDTLAMITACQQIGAKIQFDRGQLEVEGVAGQPKLPDDVINAGNSGQVLRFVAAIAALIPGYSIFTGDHSIRFNRPMQPLLEGLKQLGGFAESSKADGHAPVIIKGRMHPGMALIDGQDSQTVSALLMAAAFLPGETIIEVKNAGEKPWVNLTLNWLERLGIHCTQQNFERYVIPGNASYAGFHYTVPGDFSSAAFPIVAALVTGSEVQLENMDMQDVQGDKALIPVLQQMGANIEIDLSAKQLIVKKSPPLQGRVININDFIDAITILAVLGCYAQGETRIEGAAIAKAKECNRLVAIARELNKMGASIMETTDGLVIKSSSLRGAEVESYHDHRMVMSLAVAAMMAEGITEINEVECVQKSYPEFAQHMKKLGANLVEKS